MSDAGEHALIAQSAAGLLQQLGGLKHARAVRDAWPRPDREAWAAMADAGWLGMLVPEAQGGAAMDALCACALFDAAGEWLMPEPLPAGLAAAAVLASSHAAAPVLPAALSGSRIVLPALDAGADAAAEPAVRARRASGGLRLEGVVARVADGHWASDFLVPAALEARPALVLVPAQAPGVRLDAAATVDGGSVGALHLATGVVQEATLVAEGEAAAAAIACLEDLTALGRAALLAGLMRGALRITVDYLKTRQQFGRPIGANQVLQHRAATAQVDLTVTGALVREGGRAYGTPQQRRGAAAAAARASAAAMRVTRECIQLHGAIGFTDEYDIGLFLRRAMALAGACGGEDANLARIAPG